MLITCFFYYLFIPLICILLYIYIFYPYGPLPEIKDYYYYIKRKLYNCFG